MTDTDAGMPGGAEPANPRPGSDAPERNSAAENRAQDAGRDSREPPRLAGGERARMVPYGALAEERARRRDLQRELQESRDARQRLQAMIEGQQEATPGEPPPGLAEGPSDGGGPVDDTAEPAALPEDLAYLQAESAFRTQILQSVRGYVRTQPDFMDAYRHARQARIGELSGLGYSGDEAAAITFDNELELIRNAYANGRNPAQVIYEYAVQRGYSRNAGALRSPDKGQSHAAAPGKAPHGMSEVEKVALAARGQAGAKSLSSAGGGALGALTLEALAGLTDDEFAEATKGDRWQRLLRGS
ncbi:MAG TPA: hypothetical protein PLR41_03840 [Alphaproteobacteria bacterium]|nr:hypothetical protein [Alphaproteobacteria bacterium]